MWCPISAIFWQDVEIGADVDSSYRWSGASALRAAIVCVRRKTVVS